MEDDKKVFGKAPTAVVILCAVFAALAFASVAPAQQPSDAQAEAAKALGCPAEFRLDLGGGVKMTFVLVPAGEFMMGAPAAESPLDPDETPQTRVRFAKPFWMQKFEVSNQQYHCFDPVHDSRHIDTHWKDRVGPGHAVNDDLQPVCRVSWNQANAFCRWLNARAQGQALPVAPGGFRLPTEAEWEYACRAGSDTPWHFGASDAPMADYANLADKSLASNKPWAIRDDRFNDKAVVSARVGQFRPNPWGLHDMHGNVAEWCLSLYKPYPYRADDGRAPDVGREDVGAEGPRVAGTTRRVVRGGSWDDLPRRCRSAFRQNYPPDYRVYNVGFRVVCPVR